MSVDEEAREAINRLERRVAELEDDKRNAKQALVRLLANEHDVQRALYEAFNKVATVKKRQGLVDR